MSNSNIRRRTKASFIGLVMIALVAQMTVVASSSDAKFDVLRTKTGDYTNVTVTTTSDSFICIFHSRGMGSIRVADLPLDVQKQLGYKVETPDEKAGGASAWAQRTLSNVNLPDVDVKGLETTLGSHSAAEITRVMANPTWLFAALGIALVLYLAYCYCCMLICQKTGNEPGFLIWVPILQLFPLLRAASMSPVWFLAFLLPLFNLVAQIVWCVKITQARAKSGWVALFLVLPFTSLFAFLYLAFSGAKPPEPERGPEIMTLQTA